jgi:hypothetical protein
VERDPVFKTDVMSSAILDFGGGRRAVFTVGTQSFSMQRVDAYGTDGSLSIEVPFNMFGDVPGRLTVTNSVGKRLVETEIADQYLLQFDAFAQALAEGPCAYTGQRCGGQSCGAGCPDGFCGIRKVGNGSPAGLIQPVFPARYGLPERHLYRSGKKDADSGAQASGDQGSDSHHFAEIGGILVVAGESFHQQESTQNAQDCTGSDQYPASDAEGPGRLVIRG